MRETRCNDKVLNITDTRHKRKVGDLTGVMKNLDALHSQATNNNAGM
jgi:hypothetical protein